MSQSGGMFSSMFGDGSIQETFLAKIGREGSKPQDSSGAPFNLDLVKACAEFNANVPCSGIQRAAKRGNVMNALQPLMNQLAALAAKDDLQTTVTVELLQAVYRIVPSTHGFRGLLQMRDAPATLLRLLSHPSRHESMLHWTLSVCALLVTGRPGEREQEYVNKQLLLAPELCKQLVGLLSGSTSGAGAAPVGPLSVMLLVEILESVLCSHSDTTSAEHFGMLLRDVAGHFDCLLPLFRSRCNAIMENTALLLRTIIEESDESVAKVVQDAALSEGLLLRHIYLGVFSTNGDQRYISRYLVRLWMMNHTRAQKLLQVPTCLPASP